MKVMLVAGLALVALATAPELIAQAAASQPISPSQETLIAAAQLRLPASHSFGTVHPGGAVMIQWAQGNRRKGEILMIVGAAGIVTGLLVHEDVITIAGAVVGGVGLYFYLQGTR